MFSVKGLGLVVSVLRIRALPRQMKPFDFGKDSLSRMQLLRSTLSSRAANMMLQQQESSFSSFPPLSPPLRASPSRGENLYSYQDVTLSSCGVNAWSIDRRRLINNM